MRIELRIDGEVREYRRELDPWIHRKVSQPRRSPEVVLFLNCDGVNLALAHPLKALDHDSSVSKAPLQPREKEIYEIWQRLGLDEEHLDMDRLIRFLHQLKP